MTNAGIVELLGLAGLLVATIRVIQLRLSLAPDPKRHQVKLFSSKSPPTR